MNKSGQAAGALMRFYKLKPEQVLVLHDELDLLPGQVKMKKEAGTRGIMACAIFSPPLARRISGACAWGLVTLAPWAWPSKW